MLTNSQVIMEKIIKGEAEEQGKNYEEYFEIYSAAQILKDYDLTYSDIEYSNVGNGRDGGVDSIYTILNGELIKEDTEYNVNGRNNSIEVIIVQSKTAKNFKESVVVNFREVTRDLFDISPEEYSDDIRRRYNDDLRDKVGIFKSVYQNTMSKFPDLKFSYYYCSLGEEVHPNVRGKVENLKTLISKMFTGAKFNFEFVGASNLIELNRRVRSVSRAMELAESPITTSTGSYLCLVNLKKYYDFVCDNGSLARSIFESNVRDYNGNVTVNKGIKETLKNGKEDFWFLNNGVTIITSKAILSGKTLTIENPQVVNGLQTSCEIYSHFSDSDKIIEGRNLLVRVVCEEDEDARDRIIRATNSQTSIPPASLRSADNIHRDIEEFFKINDYYYERRKNFYKNEGKHPAKIVSISFLSQCVMALALLQPDSARARPSTLINDNNRYIKIFNQDYGLALYLNSFLVVKKIDKYMKKKNFKTKKDFNNVFYHTSMATLLRLASDNGRNITSINAMIKYVEDFRMEEITESIFNESFEVAYGIYERLGEDDNVAKGKEFVKKLKQFYGVNF